VDDPAAADGYDARGAYLRGAPVSARARRTARRGSPVRDTALCAVERNWSLMAPVMGGSLAMLGAKYLAVPGSVELVMAGVAIGLTAFTPWVRRFERARQITAPQRFALLTAVVGLPMLLFGAALSRWTVAAAGQWPDAIGILAIVGALASVILSRRVSSIIVALVALWGGAGLASQSEGSVFALVVGGIVGGYAALRQARLDAELAERDLQRERLQLRAE
jgi:hypothetical protein